MCSLWTPKGFRALSQKQQEERAKEDQKRAKEQVDKISDMVDKFLNLLSKEGFKIIDVNLFVKVLQDKISNSFQQKDIKDILEKKDAVQEDRK